MKISISNNTSKHVVFMSKKYYDKTCAEFYFYKEKETVSGMNKNGISVYWRYQPEVYLVETDFENYRPNRYACRCRFACINDGKGEEIFPVDDSSYQELGIALGF